jgi:hypothetical protein
MPSNKNPSKLNLGSGLAGKGSVSITSVTFAEDGSLIGQIRASEVFNETPLALSGDNLQEHVNQIALNAPSLPNVVGGSSNPVNPGLVDLTPDSVAGFYVDGGVQSAHLTSSTTLTIEGILFPADRGILVLEKDSVEVAALNLFKLFVEGDPEDVVSPSRGVDQVDYTAEDIAVASVNGLPQGFNLTKRLPVLDAYVGGEYEAFPQSYFAHQLTSFSVSQTQTGLTASAYRIVHYRTLKDYEAKGKTYGISNVPTSGTTIFVDSVNATPSVVSVSSNPASGTSAGAKVLSGVTYYDPGVDSLPVTFTVNNLFDNSFLNSGIKIRKRPGKDEGAADLVYTQYDGGDPSPGNPASFNAYPNYDAVLVEEMQPQLVASNAFGDTSLQTTSTADVVLAHGLTLETSGSVSTSRLTSEDFRDEATRFTLGDLTNVIEPDGFGTSWDASNTLSNGEAQVRGATLSSNLTHVLGGELGYPTANYASGYTPTGNPNYSGITGTASYYRSFNMDALSRRGKIRVTGTPVSASIWEDLKWDPTQNAVFTTNNGHQGGIRINLSCGVGSPFLDLGRPYSQGGCLISVVEEDAFNVVIEFLLEDYPEKSPRGFYPVRLEVLLYENQPAVALHQISLIES